MIIPCGPDEEIPNHMPERKLKSSILIEGISGKKLEY
jgi:hypothetical protein